MHFCDDLFDLTIGHTCTHYRITLNAEARAVLRTWYEFIGSFNRKVMFFLFRDCVSSESLKLYSEAAVFENKWFSGEWPPAMKEFTYHI